MRVQFNIRKHVLNFTFTAGTSRGSFTEKPTWFIEVKSNGKRGLGEASPLKGLSIDYTEDFEEKLQAILKSLTDLEIPETYNELMAFVQEQVPKSLPSIRFGLETALIDLISDAPFKIFDTPFYSGKQRIPINGLIWMGDEAFMQKQIKEKLKAGFSTIKMKIGAIDFETEYQLLENIRESYSANDITLRVDANGAFNSENVQDVLVRLAALDIHSIEQPIAKGQHALMKQLCAENILPIALDEELIGVHTKHDKEALLDEIKPQFVILKPSLIGGIASTQEWIDLAEKRNIGWWMTSMLESNVGLNAIAQLTATYNPRLPQGLGTGQLYHNNIASPLEIRKGELIYNAAKGWGEA